MALILNEESDIGKKVLEVEKLMREYGISVHCYGHMYLKIGKKEYQIGRDSDSFPRFIDEPLFLKQ